MSDRPPVEPVSGNVDAETGRRTWRSLEAVHGMIYFSAEATAGYAALGIGERAGYFASRAAAMGAVSAEVVIATFYNFHPDLVRSAVPAAWKTASPDQILAARIAGADATLRRVLGPAVESPEMERAAALARQAAEAVAHDLVGRPLYAAHTALPWPDPPHLVLWHAQSLLREYRGDGHVAALLMAGLTGVEALITHAATGAVPAAALRATRAWPEADWAEAVAGLRARGWLTDDPEPTLTAHGDQLRREVEDTTDRLALAPYAALGAEGCQELHDLAVPFSRPLVDALMPWARGRK